MKINTIKIKNFRGIPDMEISLERISFFTGPCGAGKTSVLKAFNFALTGDVKKDDIREQSDRASATIVFEDQSSIQRICKLSAATQVKVNGKNSTAKAADEFLQAKLGTSTDIFQAMCKTDFFEVLSQKEQTEFFLSILPTKISFEKLCEFIGENNKKLTEEEKTTLKTAFANISDPFGLDEIDMAYKYFYQKRKEKKAFVENLKPRAVFDMSILPEESKESLQKSLEDVIRKETLAKEYQKNLNEYNRQVKMKADSDVRLKKLKEEYQKYSSVEKPDPDYKEKQESEKKQFENAIHNCQTAISTIKGNLELLEKTLKSLNTNVCPISSRLICTSDRTPLKSEFEDQIQKSNEGIKKNTDFIKRCEKEVQIRTERLDAYQKQQISYNNKKNLHDQIQNYVPITVMEKPEEVKAPDMMVKQEIQSKISKYTSFENAKKAKCELEEEQKKLRILENLVLYLDSKTGVRGYILKKVVEPFTKMCNQKASKFHGSLSTGHANSPRNLCDVRIPIMYSMNKEADFSERSIAMQIAEAIKIIVQISRMPDGSRKITYISHVDGVTADGKVNIKDIFRYDELSGQFIKTKYYPKKIVESIRSKGLDFEEGIFKTKNKEESDE